MFLFSGPLWTGILGVLISICAAIYTYSKWIIYKSFEKKNIPYFEPTFPFGNINMLNTTIPIYINIFNTIKKAKEKGWNYFGIFITLNPSFVPLDLDIVKCILTKDFNHFVDRGFFYNENDDPISAHLFALGGQKWKNLRAKLTPTFTSGKMRAMFPTLMDGYPPLEKTLEEHSRKEPIDIKKVLVNFTMDSIGSIAFGINCNSFETVDSAFKENSKRVLERSLLHQFSDLLNDAFPNLARTLHRKVIPTDISQFFFDVVINTMKYRIENNIRRNDFLQLLIDIKNDNERKPKTEIDDGIQLTTNEVVAQAFVFFLAGFESTASTMTFALYEISRHPEVQEKIREELFEVLKKHDNKLSYELIKDLVYMQQVLDETLRIYSPVPAIMRVCTHDYKIPNTDVTLKKGDSVFIPIRNIHYDEKYYENPEKFDPERFSYENKMKRHPYAHIPFGGGPRTCIGLRFAFMESKMTLCQILRKFKVTLNSKTETPLELDPKALIPATKGGIWLNVERLSQ